MDLRPILPVMTLLVVIACLLLIFLEIGPPKPPLITIASLAYISLRIRERRRWSENPV